MAMQEPQAEPSMEEILASIRRIISEEDQPAPAAAAPAPVLELSQPAPEPVDDLVVYDEEPIAAPEPEPEPVMAAPPPRPVAAPPPMPIAQAIEEHIVSEPAVSAAAGAFTRLAGSLRISEAPGQTLEGMVRELIRPMLKDWLDTNLPAIVEAKVEAELDRIARLSR